MIFLPILASVLGVPDAIILQQLEYFLQRSKNVRDSKKWVYNTYSQWHGIFPCFSESTIKKTILSLEHQGILVSSYLHENGRNRTKWYRIDYEALEQTKQRLFEKSSTIPNALGQNVSIVQDAISPMSGEDISERQGGVVPSSIHRVQTESTAEMSPNTVATSLESFSSLVEKLKAVKVPAEQARSNEEIAESYRIRWNDFVQYANENTGSDLRRVNVLNKTEIRAVVAHHETRGYDFRLICNKILMSQFLLGLAKGRDESKGFNWSGASFDFVMINDEFWSKIINGKYTDKIVKRRNYNPPGMEGEAPQIISADAAERISKALLSGDQGPAALLPGT